MIDVRKDSIIYQSQVYYTNLVNTLVLKRKLGRALDSKWELADTISCYLEALGYIDNLTDEDDILNVNYILECLIILCELNVYPISAPITFQEPPTVLVGIQGPPGASIIGPQGPTGLATDFQVSLVTVPTVIDSFDIDDARGARWDYIVIQSTGEQRGGTVLGTWSDDGSNITFFDSSTEDLVGSTEALVFSVEYFAGDIRLVATPASGSWTVIGTRYFMPNNGNGSGPISDSLANGSIFIGNDSNLAQARTVSGDFTITNTGVASISTGVIVNVDINASAAIAFSKMEVLTADRVLLTNGSGQIITGSVTATEIGYLSGVTSAIQTQLGTKLTDPTTTIGDLVIRNGLNVSARLGIGTNGQVLTVAGGLPTWAAAPGGISGLTTTYLPKATSATTLGDSLISESGSAITINGTAEIQDGFRTAATGPYFKTIILEIGDWDMDSTISVTVAHGLDSTTIVAISVMIIPDADASLPNYRYPIQEGNGGGAEYDNPQGGVRISDNLVGIRRRTGGFFDGVDFNATSFNRGWIYVTYME